MNLQQLQTKLISVARKNTPGADVPYAFEKRIMARLASSVADVWEFWAKALWRAATACVIAMALLGGWSFQTASTEAHDLSQEFENTVYAAMDEQPALAISEETR